MISCFILLFPDAPNQFSDHIDAQGGAPLARTTQARRAAVLLTLAKT